MEELSDWLDSEEDCEELEEDSSELDELISEEDASELDELISEDEGCEDGSEELSEGSSEVTGGS